MKEDNWCYYSDLPSPNAYVDETDYDGMVNHHRFPKLKRKNTTFKFIRLVFLKLFRRINK